MTTKELAEQYAYELHNDADHLARLAENVTVFVGSGNYASAMEHLAIAERPAGRISMRLRDAISATAKAADAQEVSNA